MVEYFRTDPDRGILRCGVAPIQHAIFGERQRLLPFMEEVDTSPLRSKCDQVTALPAPAASLCVLQERERVLLRRHLDKDSDGTVRLPGPPALRRRIATALATRAPAQAPVIGSAGPRL